LIVRAHMTSRTVGIHAALTILEANAVTDLERRWTAKLLTHALAVTTGAVAADGLPGRATLRSADVAAGGATTARATGNLLAGTLNGRRRRNGLSPPGGVCL
jgi:hypothetical protein